MLSSVKMFSVWFLAGLLHIVLAQGDYYTIPDPVIKVCPNEFKISIPDCDGLQLFAFHGSVNSELKGIEAGQYSIDINHRDETGQWSYVNRDVALHLNDVISFWLYVQKNGLGYQRLGLSYKISDWSPDCNDFQSNFQGVFNDFPAQAPFSGNNGYNFHHKGYGNFHHNHHHSHDFHHKPFFRGNNNFPPRPDAYQNQNTDCASRSQVLELKSSMDSMEKKMTTLSDSSVKIHEDLLSLGNLLLNFIDANKFGTKLVLTGVPSAGPEEVSGFLSKYLSIGDVKVLNMEKNDSGLVFQVESVKDKVRILINRTKLRGTSFWIDHYADLKDAQVAPLPVVVPPDQSVSTPSPVDESTTEETLDVDVRFGV